MKQERLLELLSDETKFSDLVKAVSVKPQRKKTKYEESLGTLEDPLDEFSVHNHPVFDRLKRPDVPIKEKQTNEHGKEETVTKGFRKVNRIGIAMEDLIAGRAATFLCGMPVKYTATPDGDAETRLFEAFKKVNEQNKLDFKNLRLLKQRMSELEVMEIWYMKDLDADDDYWDGTKVTATKAPRLFIASPSLCDKIWPVWDNDVLIAVGREWEEAGEDGKPIVHFDLYTKERVYEGTREGSDNWTVEANDTDGKLPVIYHSQDRPEWDNARTEIRRLEFLASNLADSNDKTMSPILFVMGAKNAVELPKGEAQRAMRGDKDTDAKYITADNAPESLKLELQNLWKFALETTGTVDISPETIQGIGNISGYGIEQLFLPALMKAAEHAGTFGECLQRRINLIKSLIVAADPTLKDGMSLQIKPAFDYFIPKDTAGIVNWLATAVGADILSKETAVAILQSILGGDGKDEFEKILAQPQPDVLGEVINSAA